MKQIKQLLEESLQIKSSIGEDIIFESVNEFDTLEEAINQFAELPASWKKLQLRSDSEVSSQTGLNSKIISKASKSKFTQFNNLARFVRKAIDMEDSSIVWVELNGEPLFSVTKQYGNGNKKFIMANAEGSFEKVYQKISYSGGYRVNGKYIEPKFKSLQYLSLGDIEDKVRMNIRDLVGSIMGKNPQDVEDSDIKTLKLDISVKGLGVDENRLNLRKQRQDNTDFIDANTKLKIDTSIKYVKSKMAVNVDSIRSDLLKELDKFERGESFSFDVILDKMNKLKYIMKRLNDIKDNKSYKPYNSWSRTKDYDLKYALEYAKELENLVK